MALKNLTNEEMVQVSAGWAAGTPARAKLEGTPLLASLLPTLDEAHRNLVAASNARDNPRLREIAAEAAQLDAVHDTLLRGLYDLLTSLSLLAEGEQELLKLRDHLFPEGLAMGQRTYRGQAGAAEVIRQRLTPAVQSQLQGIPVLQTHLGERVEAWLGAAEKLGALEDERAQLQSVPPTPRGVLLDARWSWIRAVNALGAMAALANLNPSDDTIVFSALRQAEANGDARAARRRAAGVTEPSPEPVPA